MNTNKPWLKYYDPNVPSEIDPDQFNSITEMLDECFEKYSNRPCFTNFGKTLSFRKINFLSQCFAGYLQSQCGLKKGDCIAIMMPNLLQYPIALFGALRAGLIVVNINPWYTHQELQYALKQTDAKVILILENYANLLESALSDTNVKHVIVTKVGDLLPLIKGTVMNLVIKYVKKMVPKWYLPHYVLFNETLKKSYYESFENPGIKNRDLAYYLFTEGRETGVPKCVMLTHRNIMANGLQCAAFISDTFLRSKRIMTPLPFCKTVTLSVNCLTFMRLGLENILITNPRDIPQFIKEMKRYPFNVMLGLRTLFNAFLSNDAFYKLDFSQIQVIFGSAMVIPQTLADRWQAVTGKPICLGYALAESSPMAMIMPLLSTEFTGELGVPLSSGEAKICDDEGKELPINEKGEIWLKGPQIMKGYLNDPELTKLVLTEDGWFKTGDIGVMSEKGFFRFIDRKEDIIKTEHGIVYPSEVENILTEISGIEEAVVVKSQSSDGKTIAKAFITRQDYGLTEDIILSQCRRRLDEYLVPSEIEFVSNLPKTFTGYILRRLLRGE